MSWQQRAFAAVVLFCFVAYILLYSGVVLPDESAAEISQEQQLMRAQHERQRTGKLWLHQQYMAETPGCLGAAAVAAAAAGSVCIVSIVTISTGGTLGPES